MFCADMVIIHHRDKDRGELHMECIVHFELVRKDKVSPLRGIVDVEPGQKPSIHDLVQMFKDIDLEVALEDSEHFVFGSILPHDPYTIRVKKFDMGEKNDDYVEDTELKSIIANFIPKSRPL